MNLALFPRKQNLVIGAAIGVGLFFVGKWLMNSGFGGDSAEIWGYLGAAAMLGGVLVAGNNIFGLWRPRPSFTADEQGFSVMGRRKQPWDRFQGVGVHGIKQHGITTNKWVVVKVGKGPAFARKKHIKWTHLSDSADAMAAKIHAIAQYHVATQVLGVDPARFGVGAEAGAQQQRAAAPTPAPATAHDSVSQPQPKRAATPAAGEYADSPIKSDDGGLRGLFGR